MDALEKIKAKLAQYPEIEYSESENKIEVPPVDDSGFLVSLAVKPEYISVSFDDWQEEFYNEDEALDYFTLGLSSACRLITVFRGKTSTKSTVERLKNGTWGVIGTSRLVFPPLCRSEKVVYKQNKWLDRGV